ncbi:site-specific integrase [Zunongwangia pacifica]|uniref:Site-specific integrase n=1 Tax=Zunongwangia pacifica TaxID=2911062 RepID=A0A9X2A1X6_9FLAO|nr:site-specific integrase [Zunongwangia pacifica]MCL6218599.1 site-specific integrase [Zunongwangia pacifica]
MEKFTLHIRFIIALNRTKKNSEAPIFCRITYNKKRKQFSTGVKVHPDYWNNEKQKVLKPEKNESVYNSQLSLIKNKINQAFLLLNVNQENFDVDDIYLQYTGKNIKANKTLLEVFSLHNERMEKLIGIEYTKSTYTKFKEAKNHISRFLKFQYKKNDILLESITPNFLSEFDFYLKSQRNQKQITINKSIQRVRKIIKLSIAQGYLKRDPFILYKPKKHDNIVVYLNHKELQKLEQHTFKQDRLNQVKDMFIFCCYTGLAYQEMASLKEEHLVKGFDGGIWIQMMRQKTKSAVSIPLLPKAAKIIDKYKNEEQLLPIISNQKFNSYLKEIAVVVNIKKRLTHHIARKTFATTVLLYNNIPIEIVSELLGHSSITITQRHYAKVVQQRVSSQMSKLNKKLNKKR